MPTPPLLGGAYWSGTAAQPQEYWSIRATEHWVEEHPPAVVTSLPAADESHPKNDDQSSHNDLLLCLFGVPGVEAFRAAEATRHGGLSSRAAYEAALNHMELVIKPAEAEGRRTFVHVHA